MSIDICWVTTLTFIHFRCTVDALVITSFQYAKKIKVPYIWILRFHLDQLFTWYSHFLSNIIFKVRNTFSTWMLIRTIHVACMFVCLYKPHKMCVLALLIQIFLLTLIL